jgi:hypothetical protein
MIYALFFYNIVSIYLKVERLLFFLLTLQSKVFLIRGNELFGSRLTKLQLKVGLFSEIFFHFIIFKVNS